MQWISRCVLRGVCRYRYYFLNTTKKTNTDAKIFCFGFILFCLFFCFVSFSVSLFSVVGITSSSNRIGIQKETDSGLHFRVLRCLLELTPCSQSCPHLNALKGTGAPCGRQVGPHTEVEELEKEHFLVEGPALVMRVGQRILNTGEDRVNLCKGRMTRYHRCLLLEGDAGEANGSTH